MHLFGHYALSLTQRRSLLNSHKHFSSGSVCILKKCSLLGLVLVIFILEKLCSMDGQRICVARLYTMLRVCDDIGLWSINMKWGFARPILC